jgi:hypothetical protein
MARIPSGYVRGRRKAVIWVSASASRDFVIAAAKRYREAHRVPERGARLALPPSPPDDGETPE